MAKYDYSSKHNVSKCNTGHILLTVVFSLIFIASLVINICFISRMIPEKDRVNPPCGEGDGVNRVCLSCKYFEDSSRFLRITSSVNFSKLVVKEDKDVCCLKYTDSLHQLSMLVSIVSRKLWLQSFLRLSRSENLVHVLTWKSINM